MKISYEWLGDFVDLGDVTPQRAAEALTMTGVEVEAVSVIDLSEILVGRVVSQTPHPSSNKPLWIHQVDLGERTEQIIAGAPNAVPGSLVPVALPGTTVPGGTYVRDAVIAGVAGRGMLCSETELGLGEQGGGIMLLDRGRPGQSLGDLFPVEAVLHVEVTSNRPDCLSHLGVARELAAALGKPLLRDFMPLFTGGIEPKGLDLVQVTIEDPALCRRYIAAVVSEVEVRPSPAWLQRRLRSAGVRPINNVVDITNYVLLEYGQPLHAFDFDKLAGPAIEVRPARAGESLDCLDGVTRQLTPETLVIADAARPVALAGVIGGEESAVHEGSRRILVEAATFSGPSVRATARTFGLRTEASSRFEKTLSPELALAGARRAVNLLQELAGGRVHSEWPDVYPAPQEPVRVRLAPRKIDELLGVHVPLEDAEAILLRLGFHIRVEEDGSWDVLPPVFRLDVSIPEDVVEEVGRMHGYDKVPATLPGSRRASWLPIDPQHPEMDVRQVLAGAGFDEIITPALVPASLLSRLGFDQDMLRILNPLSDAMDAPRTTLLPSLLETLSSNVNRGTRDAAVFELGRVFHSVAEGGRPDEHRQLAAVLPAAADPQAGREAFLRLKSVLDRCASEALGARVAYSRSQASGFHPGRTAAVSSNGNLLGYVGELHPALLRAFDLEGRAAGFEINLDELLLLAAPRSARDLPRFPAVERDIAMVVPVEVEAARLQEAIRAAAGDLLESARAFDEYQGPQVGPGFKSLAYALTFRRPDRTLTDSEVDPAMSAIQAGVEREFGARIRGSR